MRVVEDWYQKERPGDITGEITAQFKQDTLILEDSNAMEQPPSIVALG